MMHIYKYIYTHLHVSICQSQIICSSRILGNLAMVGTTTVTFTVLIVASVFITQKYEVRGVVTPSFPGNLIFIPICKILIFNPLPFLAPMLQSSDSTSYRVSFDIEYRYTAEKRFYWWVRDTEKNIFNYLVRFLHFFIKS